MVSRFPKWAPWWERRHWKVESLNLKGGSQDAWVILGARYPRGSYVVSTPILGSFLEKVPKAPGFSLPFRTNAKGEIHKTVSVPVRSF